MTTVEGHAEDPFPPEKPAYRRRIGPAVQVLSGLVVGAAIAEAAFWIGDEGAFPHLNVYVADAVLGVRLRPGAVEHVRVAGGPPARVRINSAGLRGGDLPPPSPGEVLVVGDSQVFGLGVAENETFSAELDTRRSRGARVINAGVPTYGPLEYNAVLRELLGQRSIELVVYVVNFANDLFEASRPNTERHGVWDGWAVRKETSPASVSDFPGRALLFRESHAFFALRSVLYRRGEQIDDRGFPSEGRYQDIVRFALPQDRSSASADGEEQARADEAAIREAQAESVKAAARVDALARELVPGRHGDEADLALRVSAASPGDIVSVGSGEAARRIRVTAEAIRDAAVQRAALEAALLKEIAAATEDDRTRRVATAFEERRAARARLEALEAARMELEHGRSSLTPLLAEAKAACDARGARLLIVALPMDVQVSSLEWNKYGEEPLDMEPTKALIRDLVRSSNDLGLATLDLTAPLAAAEPGAFLAGDLHLSPRGHHAVAAALAVRLAEMRSAGAQEGSGRAGAGRGR